MLGIFDSGMGGLTVAHALAQQLPNQGFLYFGDLAHMPYGDKAEANIVRYSLEIAEALYTRGARTLIVACHTASSIASRHLEKHFEGKLQIFNVIDPVIQKLIQPQAPRQVLLMGTKQTIRKNVYQQRLSDLNAPTRLRAIATPLLAQMIEEGFCEATLIHPVLKRYFEGVDLPSLEAVILGCTHYPLIKTILQDFFGPHIQLLDPGEILAQTLFDDGDRLLSASPSLLQRQFYVSEASVAFQEQAERFFGEKISCEVWPLWGQ